MLVYVMLRPSLLEKMVSQIRLSSIAEVVLLVLSCKFSDGLYLSEREALFFRVIQTLDDPAVCATQNNCYILKEVIHNCNLSEGGVQLVRCLASRAQAARIVTNLTSSVCPNE